uniref:Hexose transporter 1 n=1 Tax=Phaeomonas parva TaxID=124430 RepID=A0A7S1UI73_9STRA|mmetsp:Transcript_6448/g.18257  ORF Transcript_6448/g.18257 Transcript_6448/m.18257 type:complete len:529 (+) Transcript_6448:250-1836(+)
MDDGPDLASATRDYLLPKSPQESYKALGVLSIFIFPSLGGLLFGFDIGATSLVVKQLGDGDMSSVSWSDTADEKIVQSALTSASVAGAFLGSVIVFPVADALGRRRELMIGAVLYMLGATLAAVGGFVDAGVGVGLSAVLIGRLIYGVGIGFSMHGAPSYISEMAPAGLRGSLVAGKEGMIVLGVLLGNVMGVVLENTEGGWRYTYLMLAALAVAMLLGCARLPPSPRWLALNGDDEGAAKALRTVFHEDVIEAVTLEIIDQVNAMRDGSRGAEEEGFITQMKRLVMSPRYHPQLICGIGVVALQQITAQPSVLYYTASIFDDAGIGSEANLLTGGFKLVATICSVVFVERMGRKQLLYVGNTIMSVALLAVSFAFINYDKDGGLNAQKIVILTCLLAYIGGYQVGFGPVAWTLISEVFPLEVRGQAVALAVQVNFFLNLVVTFLFLIELDAIGSTLTFAVFAGILAGSVFFVYKYVPETKGLTLEEIETFFFEKNAHSILPPTLPADPFDNETEPLQKERTSGQRTW